MTTPSKSKRIAASGIGDDGIGGLPTRRKLMGCSPPSRGRPPSPTRRHDYPLAHPSGDLVRGHWPAEKVTLRELATETLQLRPRLGALDPFRDDLQAKVSTKIDRG